MCQFHHATLATGKQYRLLFRTCNANYRFSTVCTLCSRQWCTFRCNARFSRRAGRRREGLDRIEALAGLGAVYVEVSCPISLSSHILQAVAVSHAAARSGPAWRTITGPIRCPSSTPLCALSLIPFVTFVGTLCTAVVRRRLPFSAKWKVGCVSFA